MKNKKVVEPKITKDSFQVVAEVNGETHAMILSDEQRQAMWDGLSMCLDEVKVSEEPLRGLEFSRPVNREIKFKVWSPHTGRMWSWEEVVGCWNMEDVSKINAGNSESVLRQYTGLLDKNGVEIYEGDILKCTSGCGHEIIWSDQHSMSLNDVHDMPRWYVSGLNDRYTWTGREEVIGNIYQNPELLNKEENSQL